MFTSIPARAAAIGDIYGPYIYMNAQSGLCINNPNSSTSNVTMIAYTCSGSPSATNERWKNKTAVTTTDFQTINVASDRCLTVLNASTALYQPIIQYPCTTGANERWKYVPYSCNCIFGDTTIHGYKFHFVGVYRIQSLNSPSGHPLCITIKGASHASGTVLQQYTCGGGSEDIWEQFTPE